ncbi:trimeric intracellular cation channel family protein [Rhodocyclus tenuis]|uniref:Trimeric intracellular cation channel family protein n=2 Tax=Rhodocyclus TaxID=1064 RepID=A0A6L5JTC3_RHOTE|nr:trimeric intracellular cation channel family protein [Rhodocyclus gracilis]MQY50396.1 trimeric intracellular cation channel family protein [Rhodocyclus gracilis]MRD71707.1 trimeric intracellular cation channel family protein [Rhodocyclus gracilis]NJA87899.1 trimeric intracellular cation channel family protein [Rhodocyclus gracilis]
MEALLYWAGIAAVAVNAITGVLESERKRMDLVGAVTVATATAIGGGTLRDVILNREVFWVADQTYLATAIGIAILTFFWARRRKISPEQFLYPDAIGLALFSVVGAQAALLWHAPWLVASIMGVITGVFGGVLRDVFCNQVPLIFLPGELYASVAWVGALTLIGLQAIGVDGTTAAWIAMAVILVLRAAAIHFRIRLPTFHEPS